MLIDGKSRIMEAAKQVICRNGIAGATMRGIAEEAGLSTGAIYHYYKSKEEILYEVMNQSLSESSRIAEKSQDGKLSGEEIAEEIYKNIIKRFHKEKENRMQFYLAHEAMLGDNELKERFKEKYSEWITRTEELMQYMYGKEPTKYNKAFATLLIGTIDGVVMQLLLGANPAGIDEITEIYHHILKEGIPKFLNYLENIE